MVLSEKSGTPCKNQVLLKRSDVPVQALFCPAGGVPAIARRFF